MRVASRGEAGRAVWSAAPRRALHLVHGRAGPDALLLLSHMLFFHDGRRIRGPDQAKGPEGYQLVSPRVNPEGFKIRGPPLAPRFLLRVSPEGYHLLVLRRRIAVVNPLQ